MNLLKISMLSLMFIALTGFGQTAFAKAPDDQDGDGIGSCDGLDKKGGLYSYCIRAHSAQNLVNHLVSTGVTAGQALMKADDNLDEMLDGYAGLCADLGDQCGSSEIPGFAPPPATWDECEQLGLNFWNYNGAEVGFCYDPTETPYSQDDCELGSYWKQYVDAEYGYCLFGPPE